MTLRDGRGVLRCPVEVPAASMQTGCMAFDEARHL
jgi:hypothetical protein